MEYESLIADMEYERFVANELSSEWMQLAKTLWRTWKWVDDDDEVEGKSSRENSTTMTVLFWPDRSDWIALESSEVKDALAAIRWLP